MLIGVDAGGTSTRAVVLDSTGRCWGVGTGGGGNPVALGPAQAGRGIGEAVERAVRMARAADPGHVDWGTAGEPLGAAVLAMAGASSFMAPGVMASPITEVCPVERVEVVSDLIAMFSSGTPAENGYVLVSGTGAAALRVENLEVVSAADGLGWLLGDVGSGFWIGHRAVRAALAAMSGHGPATALAGLLRKELDLPASENRTPRGRLMALETAVEHFYQMSPITLSKYAALAFQAAKVPDPGDSGRAAEAHFSPDADAVAVEILTSAVDRLSTTLRAVRSPRLPGPVVLGGTVARRLPGLIDAVSASFTADDMDAPDVSIASDGAVGAAVMVLRLAGVTVDDAAFARVSSTLAELRR